jgi:AraC-like DNA-binding protein
MLPTFEKLLTNASESFRCFNRNTIRTTTRWHHHPEFEITYVEQGSGTRLIGDHIGTYRDGDLVFCGSDLPHTWMSDEYRDQKYDLHPSIVIQFHPEFLGQKFFQVPECESIRQLFERSRRGLFFPRQFAAHVGKKMTDLTQKIGTAKLFGLLECLSEMADCQEFSYLASDGYTIHPDTHSQTRIQRVCDFISRNLTNVELDHPQVARVARMEGAAFSRFFRKSTGRTFVQYVNEMRIGLACRMLVDTDVSIVEICQKTGFNNISNFNRRFRELRALTPREYRHQFKNATIAYETQPMTAME